LTTTDGSLIRKRKSQKKKQQLAKKCAEPTNSRFWDINQNL
jgi:hypothetical protein